MVKPCPVCSEGGHGFTKCPRPLLVPSTPQRPEESEAQYHRRLRKNAYVAVWMQRKNAADPAFGARQRKRSSERAAAHPNSPARVRTRRATDRSRIWLDAQKDRPCLDCGGRFPLECMQFDHRPGETKLFNIGMRSTLARARLVAEIAKCDVVCANCHAIRTTGRIRERLKSRDAVYTQPARAPKRHA